MSRKVRAAGVQLSTHDFLLLFFFAPILGGERVFAQCFGHKCPRTTGGSAFFLNFFGPNTGGRASSARMFCETRGANGRQICWRPFFLLRGGFWAISGGGRACTDEEAEEGEEEEEEEEEEEAEQEKEKEKQEEEK